MFIRNIAVLLYLGFIIAIKSELIEKCELPWKPYHVHGVSISYQSNRCLRSCSGKAFHTEEGKLICFSEKSTGKTRVSKTATESHNVLCDCGISLPSQRGKKNNWMSCEDNLELTTKMRCREHCKEVTIYLYRRQGKKRIVYCENMVRKAFYDISGTVGKTSYDNQKWECTCGINDKILKQSLGDGIGAVHFEECSSPWHPKAIAVAGLEVCLPYCERICGKGVGFYHHGKPFCYHRSVPTMRKTTSHGNLNGCECGYIKHSDRKIGEGTMQAIRKYVDCEPRISEYNLTRPQCNKLCRESYAFLYKTHQKPLSVRCVKNVDFSTLNPAPLLAKCVEAIALTRKTKKCLCGLNKLAEISSSKKIFYKMGELQLPDGWNVKKKRSSRKYGKSAKDVK